MKETKLAPWKNKTNKPSARLIKQKGTENQKRRDYNSQEHKKITKEYHELYASKLDNLEEMDEFLETHNLPTLK